jgi:hypothetical protein
MRFPKTVSLVFCAALLAALAVTAPAAGQSITTANIAGSVVDQQGGALPGATIVALHTPTGTSYQAVTQADGRFSILNVRVGPYSIKVTMPGFKDQELQDVTVTLGEDRTVAIKMTIASVAESVTVTAEAPPIDTAKAGAAYNISNEVKESLPTINRSINDIVRSNPMFVMTGSGAGADANSIVSVAGTTFRYNSLQIDGAVNNDLFGLNGSAGVPGGNTGTQPISLDAIQEIQLVVSPYDVRQGGFSGGGVNAITKSGSNDFHGTAFFFGRNQSWVGNGITDTPISNFGDKQGGFSVGGPVQHNKIFFFAALDDQRKQTPTGISVGSNKGQFNDQALVDQFLSILENQYGYNPGPNPEGEFSRATNSNKFFGRVDFNLKRGEQLTLRHNYVGSLTDIGTPTATTFRTPDAYYRQRNRTNSTVGQLNSAWGSGVNELRVAFTDVADFRGAQPFEQRPFPQITVVLTGTDTIVAGREQFSHQNEIDQRIVEVTDSFTRIKGNHTFTVGTHDEFFHFRDLFIRDNFGTYRFSNIANFQAGLAQQYDYSFSASSDPLQAPEFGVAQLGFYAGDTWRVRSNFTLTPGLRFDAARFLDTPHANPVAVADFGYRTDIVPNNSTWSPRLGFNWDPSAMGREQVRGGIGAFTGRPPYVWIMNQYGNTGVDFNRVGAANNSLNRVPFTPGAPSPIVTGAVANTTFNNEIDLIDPNFKYPRVLRGNLAYDRQLPWGLTGTFEYVWSKTLEDISYQNLNFQPSPTVTGIGGRPFMVKQFSTLSDVILARNTTEGHGFNLSYLVRKRFQNSLFFTASYSYGRAFAVYDTTSDQAASVWGNAYIGGNPNEPQVTRSTYDPGNRVTLSGSYDIKVVHDYAVTASLFYAGQSGRPYSLVFFPDVNGDTKFNDLFYIPSSATDQNLTYTNGTYQDLANFIQSDPCLAKYVGQIFPRNACRSPWNNTLDARLGTRLPFKKVSAEITLDILNFMNLLSSSNGIIQYSSFAEINPFSTTPSTPTLTSPITGYNLATLTAKDANGNPTFSKFLRDDLRSRWQMQLGARFRF